MMYLVAGNENVSKKKSRIELWKVVKSWAKFEASFQITCTVFNLLFSGHEWYTSYESLAKFSFRAKFLEAKKSFSKFCTLRSKWSILPGAAGTHSLCVFTIHQNAKLLLSWIGSYYKELPKILVCGIDSKQYMAPSCLNCP